MESAASSPAVLLARAKIEELRSTTAARYKKAFAVQADLGTTDLPERSDAAVLSLLDAIQSAGGNIPANLDPPFGRTPPFLVAFGAAWKEAHATLLAAEADAHAALLAAEAAARAKDLSARDALSHAAVELHALYPAPSNTDADLDAATEARGARVLAEANALTVAELKAEVASLTGTVATLLVKVEALSARKALPLLHDFSVAECCAAGYNAAQLMRASFTASELRFTFTAAELKAGGFSASELKAGGFDNGQLWDAGFRCKEGHTRDDAVSHCGTCPWGSCCPPCNPFR